MTDGQILKVAPKQSAVLHGSAAQTFLMMVALVVNVVGLRVGFEVNENGELTAECSRGTDLRPLTRTFAFVQRSTGKHFRIVERLLMRLRVPKRTA